MSRSCKGHAPDRETAAAIFRHMRERLSAYKLVRRLEFFRAAENNLRQDPTRSNFARRASALAERGERAEAEFRIEDF